MTSDDKEILGNPRQMAFIRPGRTVSFLWRADGRGLCSKYEDFPGKEPDTGKRFPWIDHIEAPVAVQATAIYGKFKEALANRGEDLTHLVCLQLYQRDKRFFPVFDRVRRHYEPSAPTPNTTVGMGRFDPSDEARFCIDGIGLRPEASKTFGRRVELAGSAEHASAALFSPVVGSGSYIFIGGQIPIDTSNPGAPLIRNYEDIPEEGRFLQAGKSHEDTRNGPMPPRPGSPTTSSESI